LAGAEVRAPTLGAHGLRTSASHRRRLVSAARRSDRIMSTRYECHSQYRGLIIQSRFYFGDRWPPLRCEYFMPLNRLLK